MTIRIVIADDHPVVLDGLAKLFAGERDFEVVATAVNGEEALRAVRKITSDVLTLDLRMPGKGGIAVLAEMQRDGLATKVVLLTAIQNEEVFVAINLGVHGVVLKDMALPLLVECIRVVHGGGRWIEKASATRAVNRMAGGVAQYVSGIGTTMKLTPRELQIARMVADGLPSKQVAGRLAITEGTAKLHLHHVYSKLNLHGRTALMRYAQCNPLE